MLGLLEPKLVGALPGPGKADSQLAAFFLAQEGGRRSGGKSDTHIGR